MTHPVLPQKRSLHKRLALSAFIAALPAFFGMQAAFGDPLLDKGAEMLRAGRVEPAIAVYTEALRLHPGSIPAQLALANIAIRRFEFEKARRILEQALAQHPDSPEVAASLGSLFLHWANSPTGKAADNARDYLALAQEHLTQAISIGPRNLTALAAMAEWKIQQDDLPAADRYLRQALQINPGFIPALQAQVRFYMKSKDLPRAKDVALHALEVDPQNSATYFLVAQLLAQASHPAEAVQYAEKSAQLDYGKLPERDYFLATQYETLGELKKAAQAYRTLAAYTPRDAQVWMKLGDLHSGLHQTDESLKAYRKALQLNPNILKSLYAEARENTRNEKITLALQQWRKILAIQPDDPETRNEAWGAIAGLHYLNRFLHPDTPSADASRDMNLLAGTQAEKTPIRLLDQAKLLWASEGLTERVRQQLLQLLNASDARVAGEAAFLLGDYAKSRSQLENVDGLSAEEYLFWADRLLLDQALVFSQVFYQRAYELTHSPEAQAGINRVQAKTKLASQRLNAGNNLFQSKDYKAALAKYQEASQIYPEWDTAYLRLGDTYEQLKDWPRAKLAFEKAVALSPSLMDSKGFAKNYQRITKRAR
jgi:tetratricopeptide (TPR) repeat protein